MAALSPMVALSVQSIEFLSPNIIGTDPGTSTDFRTGAFNISSSLIRVGNASGTVTYQNNMVPVNPVSVYVTNRVGSNPALFVDYINTNSASGTVRLSANTVNIVGVSTTNDNWFIFANDSIRTTGNGVGNANNLYLWAQRIGFSSTEQLFFNTTTTGAVYFGSTLFPFSSNAPAIKQIYFISDRTINIATLVTSLSEDTVQIETDMSSPSDIVLLTGALMPTNNDRLTIISSNDIIAGRVVTTSTSTTFEPSVYYGVSFDFRAARNIGTSLLNIGRTSELYSSITQRFPERALIINSIGVSNTATNLSVIIPIVVQTTHETIQGSQTTQPRQIDLSRSSEFSAIFATNSTIISDASLPVYALIFQDQVLPRPINIFNIRNNAAVNSDNPADNHPSQNFFVGLTVRGDLTLYNQNNQNPNQPQSPFHRSVLQLSAVSAMGTQQANIINEFNQPCPTGAGSTVGGPPMVTCYSIPLTARVIDLYADGRIGTAFSPDSLHGGILIDTTPYNSTALTGLQAIRMTARHYVTDTPTAGGVFLSSNLNDQITQTVHTKRDIINLLPNRLNTNTYTWLGTGIRRIELTQYDNPIVNDSVYIDNDSVYIDNVAINLPTYTVQLNVLNGNLLVATNAQNTYSDMHQLSFENGGLSTSIETSTFSFIASDAPVFGNLELNVSGNIGNRQGSDNLVYQSLTDIAPVPIDPEVVYLDVSSIVGTLTINNIRLLSTAPLSSLGFFPANYTTVDPTTQSILLLVRQLDGVQKTHNFGQIIGGRISIIGINKPTLSIAQVGAYSYFRDQTPFTTEVLDQGTESIRIQGVGTLLNANPITINHNNDPGWQPHC